MIADPVLCHWYHKEYVRTTYAFGDTNITGKFKENLYLEANPGIVDAEHHDFNLSQDSPAWKLGFKPIPFGEIGLRIDEYRKAVPPR